MRLSTSRKKNSPPTYFPPFDSNIIRFKANTQANVYSSSPLFSNSFFPSVNDTLTPKFQVNMKLASEAINNSFNPTIPFCNNIEFINDIVAKIVEEIDPAPSKMPSADNTDICPLSGIPIIIPARGVNCDHSQCFDLKEFLLISHGADFPCPICKLNIKASELRFDPNFFQDPSLRKMNEFDINYPISKNETGDMTIWI